MISGDASRHLLKSLRKRLGDAVVVFNGTGGFHAGEIISTGKNQTTIQLHDFIEGPGKPVFHINLVQGISRGQHMDYTLQKSVELGVQEIFPAFTDYSNVSLDEKRLGNKIEHWQKIIISACEQCGRDVLPRLHQPLTFTEGLQALKSETKILLDPSATQGLSDISPGDNEISLVCGPEGGFSENEIDFAKNQNLSLIKLGPRVLRTETAAVAAISACQVLWGDMR